MNYNPDHHIQRYILDQLRHHEYARFRDLREPGVDSNVFTYHLKQLLSQHFIEKSPQGYTLSLSGMAYIDRVSKTSVRLRQQPKIMTISVIMNEYGEVLVRRKSTQPMINKMTFPCGMMHMEDANIEQAALREIKERMSITLTAADHIGDCYMTVRHNKEVVMSALMHVFLTKLKKTDVSDSDVIFWQKLDDLTTDTAPATRAIAKELAHITPGVLFFKEYSEDL